MQFKIFVAVSITLLISLAVTAQTMRKPFADIDKEEKVLTLTNGKYEEFFDEDSLQRIGTALININTMKIVKLQLTEDEQRIMDNSAASRFLSVDPLTRNFAMLTPYQYASNKPINSIDIDGAEATEMIHWIAVVGTSRQAAKLAAPTLKTIAGINEKQTQYIFGFSNGVVSAFDIQGLVQTYQGYSIQAMKELFSLRMNTFMTEDMSYENLIKQLPIVEMARDSYYNLQAAIGKAYSGDAYATGQVQAMCLTACIGGLAGGDLAALRSVGGSGIRVSELLAANIKVTIPYGNGLATQSATASALNAMVQASEGAPLYRLGVKGESMTGDAAQFWSLENPLSMTPEAYAKKYGVNLDRVLRANQLETSTLKPGAKFITREAPAEDGAPAGAGGGIEVVTQQGGTSNNVVSPIKR